MTEKSLNETQKNIVAVYALIGAGSLMMTIPYSLLPFAGLACSMVGFVSAYVYRWKHKDNQKMQEHMTYIIRTVWWSSLILLIGTAIFASILVSNGDLSMINDLMANAENGMIPSDGDIRAMQAMFVHENMRLITIGAVVGLLPYPLYLIYRMVKGVRRI